MRADQKVVTEVVIERPAAEVWAVIADVENYGAWNPMYRFENTRLAVGTKATLVITMGRFPARLKVDVEEAVDGKIFRWGSGVSFIGGSHYLLVEPLSETSCRLEHGEQFRGLGWVWPRMAQKVHDTYQEVSDRLKAYVESR